MRIGILGSGHIGGALGRLWAAAGHEVLFASRNPERLGERVTRAGGGARAGTPDEAMAWGEVVLDALPYRAALALPAEGLLGKVLVTASNYYPQRDGEIDLGGLTQSEALALRLPGTRVAKAFNMMEAAEIEVRAEGEERPALAILVAGDDADSRDIAARLVREAGFAAVEAGPLAEGWLFQTDGPFYARKMGAEEARERLMEARKRQGAA